MDASEMAPMRTFAAQRGRQDNRSGPCDKMEFAEDVMFLNLDALPAGWNDSVQDSAFYLDYEECY
eukprot:7002081-Pyramimonas_sp.AAC.1